MGLRLEAPAKQGIRVEVGQPDQIVIVLNQEDYLSVLAMQASQETLDPQVIRATIQVSIQDKMVAFPWKLEIALTTCPITVVWVLRVTRPILHCWAVMGVGAVRLVSVYGDHQFW